MTTSNPELPAATNTPDPAIEVISVDIEKEVVGMAAQIGKNARKIV